MTHLWAECLPGTCRHSRALRWAGGWGGSGEWAQGNQEKEEERASEQRQCPHPPTEPLSPSVPSVHALQTCPGEKAFPAPIHPHWTTPPPMSGTMLDPREYNSMQNRPNSLLSL